MSFPSAVWVVSAGSQMPVGSLVPEATRCRAFQSMMATKMGLLSGSPMPTGAPECLLASIVPSVAWYFTLHAPKGAPSSLGLSEFYYARPQAVFVEDAGHQVAGCDVDEGRGCRGQFRAIAAAHSVESPPAYRAYPQMCCYRWPRTPAFVFSLVKHDKPGFSMFPSGIVSPAGAVYSAVSVCCPPTRSRNSHVCPA